MSRCSTRSLCVPQPPIPVESPSLVLTPDFSQVHVFVTGHYIVAFIFSLLVASSVSTVCESPRFHLLRSRSNPAQTTPSSATTPPRRRSTPSLSTCVRLLHLNLRQWLTMAHSLLSLACLGSRDGLHLRLCRLHPVRTSLSPLKDPPDVKHSGIHAPETAHPGVTVRVLVVLAEAFLALTAVGYAFQSRKGDLAGAGVLAWVLYGIYDRACSLYSISWPN